MGLLKKTGLASILVGAPIPSKWMANDEGKVDFKGLVAMGLGGQPRQVFESDAMRTGSEWIGKAIPNEFSEQQYGQGVPVVSWITSGIGATDAAATAYSDTDSVSKAWEAGTAGTFGKKRSPGQYQTGGVRENVSSKDAFRGMIGNQVGGVGNFAGRIFGGKTNWGNQVSKITSPLDDAIQPSSVKELDETPDQDTASKIINAVMSMYNMKQGLGNISKNSPQQNSLYQVAR